MILGYSESCLATTAFICVLMVRLGKISLENSFSRLCQTKNEYGKGAESQRIQENNCYLVGHCLCIRNRNRLDTSGNFGLRYGGNIHHSRDEPGFGPDRRPHSLCRLAAFRHNGNPGHLHLRRGHLRDQPLGRAGPENWLASPLRSQARKTPHYSPWYQHGYTS